MHLVLCFVLHIACRLVIATFFARLCLAGQAVLLTYLPKLIPS